MRNADVCRARAENFILHYAALVGGFYEDRGNRLPGELGRGISWQPGPRTAKGRAIATVNIGGGLIFYGCADKLEDDKKKKKKKTKKDKEAKKKSKSAKKAVKSKVKEVEKAKRQASRTARQTSRQAVKQGANSGASRESGAWGKPRGGARSRS